jgi:hypothetical protein
MSKQNATFVLSLLTVLTLSVMASAAFSISPTSGNLDHDAGSFVFDVDTNESVTAYVDYGSLNQTSSFDTNQTLKVNFNDSISFGTINGYATNGVENKTFTRTINYDFCYNRVAGSKLNIVDYEINNLGRGDDEEWEYLDEVEIEVEVENPTNDDIEDVLVEIRVFDENGNDVTSDFDFDDEEIDLGRIKDDDSEIAVFKIDRVKVEDINKGDYRIYIRAYSEEDDKCTDDIDGDDYLPFEIKSDLEDDFLVDESDEIFASCGDSGVLTTFDVWNLGGDKEEKILVNLYGSSIGVDEYVVIDDLRSGKEESVSFLFNMPDYVSRDYYNLDVLLHYEYDEDDGSEFEERAYDEEVEDTFSIKLNILDCKAPEPTVTVSTDDEIKVGEEFKFEVSIKNNAADSQVVVLGLGDVSSWAKDVSFEPSVVTLDGGETGKVIITLLPTEKGSHRFSLQATMGTDTYSQPVSIDVDAKWAFGKYFSGDYWEYWAAIGLVVLILIVLIAIIAVMRR